MRLYLDHRPAVVIADIVRPDKDGMEVVRADGRHRPGFEHFHHEREGQGADRNEVEAVGGKTVIT